MRYGKLGKFFYPGKIITNIFTQVPIPHSGDLFEMREIVLLFSSSSIFMLSSVFTNLFCIIYSYQMLLFLVSADARLLTNFQNRKFYKKYMEFVTF